MNLVAHAATVAVAGGLLAAGAPKVTLTPPGHRPKIGTPRNYSVTATTGQAFSPPGVTIAKVQ